MSEGRPRKRKLQQVVIISIDGQSTSISEDAARKSKRLTDILKNFRRLSKVTLTQAHLELNNFDAKTIRKVFEWCEKNYPPKEPLDHRTTLADWEREFMDSLVRRPPLATQVLKCAKYFQVTELMDAIARHVVERSKPKEMDFMTMLFQFPNNMAAMTKPKRDTVEVIQLE